MQKLIQGLHEFQTTVFDSQRALFDRLAQGQSPETLFITCSDSCIDPNLITQTAPGDLFILRNASNMPPHGAAKVARGEWHLHGWVDKIETGEAFAYDSATGQFVSVDTTAIPVAPTGQRRRQAVGI
jgi:carbonic anhydrase